MAAVAAHALELSMEAAENGTGGDHSSPAGTPRPSKFAPAEFRSASVSVIVLGASGDLAKKKTLPALYGLFLRGLLPAEAAVVGYARSDLSRADFHDRISPNLEKVDGSSDDSLAVFLGQCHYVSGQYDSSEDFAALHDELIRLEDEAGASESGEAHRLFYLALPPKVFASVSATFEPVAMSQRGWNRVVVEKPFGRDLASSNELVAALAETFTEDQQFRIDHYLGKEAALNMVVFRFANLTFQPLWNRNYISTVEITFKEPFGTEGRGGYFDEIGIVRDVMQNHLLQLLALTAMERPISLSAEDVRDEKVKVLRCIEPLTLDDILIGQYVANEETGKPGYTDDDGVPDDSRCATFATAAFNIRNERWDGVPFIIRCGKALNERKANIRIQLRDTPGQLFGDAARNELVFRIQPSEAIYLKVMAKKPGLGDELVQTELDLTYHSRFPCETIPDAYERLLYDVLRGDRSHFVRADELEAAWRIFDDVLHKLDDGAVEPLPYVYGSRGPDAADDFVAARGYVRSGDYSWQASSQQSPSKL
ncbi:glucose-6-phosphate dehydrogenase [Thecamonas trahens ATCC 50062]|uniref:Glucose-6-phosphate 1-dehydrogenase n=1 Tax=Thecamonas trahens ATCC 50062 TaxID=461836 RepID=A0A0L0DLI6_THETB|nr:glucose-6-phosphate dehydrogenase [Thecamonas trahens ATCC 50062]KNC53167.1 glucose-6-phosphate dehydrogenase [Thecamonas trahens ATCC 50062]|eukprot:XP_013754640.1 glucose-6-phosphate dehydrogenase [Thecamonas trahens ATCC 50062]